MTRVYIAIGSNIAPEKNIPAALEALAEYCAVKKVSRFYRSRPIDRPEQDDFLNGACLIETDAFPKELKFSILRPIEQALGRVRTDDAYAARTIDLDIVLYGDTIIDEDGLNVPDPEIVQRPFLFMPLLDLDERMIIPGTGKMLRELVELKQYEDVTVERAFTETLRKEWNTSWTRSTIPSE